MGGDTKSKVQVGGTKEAPVFPPPVTIREPKWMPPETGGPTHELVYPSEPPPDLPPPNSSG